MGKGGRKERKGKKMSEIGGGGKNRGKQLRHSLKKKRKDGGRRKNLGKREGK